MKCTYRDALLQGHRYLLQKYPKFLIMGQGLTNPWYSGGSIKDLDKEFGPHRIIETPVSEDAVTAIGAGASLCGYPVMVVHPRLDFMVLAANAIANQISKWCFMLGGEESPWITIRGILNRGGEQGAQHSQALQAWFAHIPGIRVVTPALPEDARELLIASVLCRDPVLFIDDRWCYESEGDLGEIKEIDLRKEGPKVVCSGNSLTLVSSGYSTQLALRAIECLNKKGIYPELIDLRVVNPLRDELIVSSVEKTGRLLVVDGGWGPCGLAGEVISSVAEKISYTSWKAKPRRIHLPFAPAPSSGALEKQYYPTLDSIVYQALECINE